MKIIAKILGEDPTLAEKLVNEGINAELVKGGVVIDLKIAPTATLCYEIPKQIDNAPLFIDITECYKDDGPVRNASVVCALDGSKLKPYYTPFKQDIVNNNHLYFAVLNSVVEVTTNRKNKTISITEHTLVRDGKTAKIVSKIIWTGYRQLLPGIYEKFNSAAEIAEKKCEYINGETINYSVS